MRNKFKLLLISLGLTLLLFPAGGYAQKFMRDDPVWEDCDRLPIPMPKPIELSQIADFLANTFLNRPQASIPPAENTNTLGEVPDSSWFTNRIGVRPMSIDEITRGPNQVDGPDLSRPWEVVSVKSEGITPGLRIRDGRGDVYFIKFDPHDYPQLTTSTEVIATKFFHAFGYHVPENYLAFLDPNNFRIPPGATIEDHDKERPLSKRDIEYLLERVEKRPDGTIQVIASRLLPGHNLGPFTYLGTRSDDPNDIFPHQNRRELRGLRLLAAWLNHDDARSINSIDMYIQQGETGYILHHLSDFGSCLGSGSVMPQNPRAGNEYLLESDPLIKAGLTLGIWDRPWRRVKYPNYPGVGNFEGEFFDPAQWRPEYPNPAFERMLPEDAFWASKIVQRFSDEIIRAIVRTGKLDDAQAEDYLVDTLIKRRGRILARYFALVNPLDGFELIGDSSRLRFQNLGILTGLAEQASYRYQWYKFDNQQERLDALALSGSTDVPDVPIPQDSSSYLMVRIHTIAPQQPAWNQNLDVYLWVNTAEKKIVGIERGGGSLP